MWPTHRAHEGVQHADGEGRAAGEGLGEVQLRVRVIVVVLVQELDVGVVDWREGGREESKSVSIHTHAYCLRGSVCVCVYINTDPGSEFTLM